MFGPTTLRYTVGKYNQITGKRRWLGSEMFTNSIPALNAHLTRRRLRFYSYFIPHFIYTCEPYTTAFEAASYLLISS